jgi:hypothetical protein
VADCESDAYRDGLSSARAFSLFATSAAAADKALHDSLALDFVRKLVVQLAEDVD